MDGRLFTAQVVASDGLPDQPDVRLPELDPPLADAADDFDDPQMWAKSNPTSGSRINHTTGIGMAVDGGMQHLRLRLTQ